MPSSTKAALMASLACKGGLDHHTLDLLRTHGIRPACHDRRHKLVHDVIVLQVTTGWQQAVHTCVTWSLF
jgi:hypothetical protein